MLHRQNDLDEARQPRSLERVTDISFHATDRNLVTTWNVSAHQRGQCTQFCGVTYLSAGGMGFNIIDCSQFLEIRIGSLDRKNLTLASRGPKAASSTITRNTESANDGSDPISIGNRARECFNDQRDISLGGDQSIGLLAEREGTVIADRLGRGEKHQAIRLAIRRAPDNCLVYPACQQTAGTDRQSLQGGCARRIDH